MTIDVGDKVILIPDGRRGYITQKIGTIAAGDKVILFSDGRGGHIAVKAGTIGVGDKTLVIPQYIDGNLSWKPRGGGWYLKNGSCTFTITQARYAVKEGIIYMLADNGHTYTTTDGNTWTDQGAYGFSISFNGWVGIPSTAFCYHDGYFYLYHGTGTYWYWRRSVDAVSWTTLYTHYELFTLFPEMPWLYITSHGYRDAGRMRLHSYDGKLWMIPNYRMDAGGIWYDPPIYYSADACATWTLTSTPAEPLIGSTVFNGKLWILRTVYGAWNALSLYSSTDGINWTLESNPPLAGQLWYGQQANRLEWFDSNDKYLYYYKEDTVICYSPDGITWITKTPTHTIYPAAEGYGQSFPLNENAWFCKNNDSFFYELG